MLELVAAFFDDLVVVDPDVALAGEHVDMSLGFPVSVSLAAIGIPESEVHSGEFFILKQNPDHFGQSKVGAESELANPVAIFVGVAIAPEFLLQILAGTLDAYEPRALDLQLQRRGLQIAILPVEMVASSGVANESPINGRRCSKNLTRRQVRPVARADQSAGLHPVEAAVEVRGDFRPSFGFYREGFGAKHALAQLVAQAIHHAVVRAHTLLHDLW